MPLKPKHKLGESRNMALKQFFQLEKRFQKKPALKSKYIEFMREYVNLGFMRPASEIFEKKLAYWIPHHAVESKFRVVFNGSANFSGESLNACQMVGPKLQLDLQLQIMRFRRKEVGIATDISKMYNRIGVNPKHWNLQRVFWRENSDEQLKEYVLTVVTFGLASSPCNAVLTLNQCATDYEKNFPKAAKIIQTCFYIDDGIFSCETPQEAKILCKEIEFVLNQGGFPLKIWQSNSSELENYMNSESSSVTSLREEDETKILGLCWLKGSDELAIRVKNLAAPEKWTKRIILSEITKLYDPNGFISPVIVKAKMLMQKIWRDKDLKWDNEASDDIKREWLEFYSNLALLSQFRVNRWLKMQQGSKIQIHGFCDASEKAYGVAIYVRIENNDNQVKCSLLSAKSRVAPLKNVSNLTIPRLELLAALMLAEQLQVVVDACEFQNAEITLWSDSIVVLQWINKRSSELKAFVANRVNIIREKTKAFVWKHVSSGDNPADLVSRGMRIKEFIKNNFWLKGPAWLEQPMVEWPKSRMEISPEISEQIKRECKLPSTGMPVLNIVTDDDKTTLYNKFGRWEKIVNITAYILRFRPAPHDLTDVNSIWWKNL